jgi:hypothetical protein
LAWLRARLRSGHDHRYGTSVALDRRERQLAFHYCARRSVGRNSRPLFVEHARLQISAVAATINDVTWRTSVFPQKSGGYILPIKAEVRRRAGIAAGDDVTVSLELV